MDPTKSMHHPSAGGARVSREAFMDPTKSMHFHAPEAQGSLAPRFSAGSAVPIYPESRRDGATFLHESWNALLQGHDFSRAGHAQK